MSIITPPNPFAAFAGFEAFKEFPAFSLPPSKEEQQIIKQVSLPKCEDTNYIVNELSSGAFGIVYQCIKTDNINYVYKHFSDITEFERVKINLEKIIPMLGQELLNSTCFAGMTWTEICKEGTQYYKMQKCIPLNKNIYNNITEITQILNLIKTFTDAGFIHGDIKFDNIMKLNGKYVLTDLDDMCHIKVDGTNIFCSNNNSPMYTPLFVHPVYLWFRSEEKNSIPNTTLKQNDIIQLQTLYTAVYNLQGPKSDKKNEILSSVLKKLELIKNKFQYKQLIYKYLIYADVFALFQCINFNIWLGVVPELYNITIRGAKSHPNSPKLWGIDKPFNSTGGFKAHAYRLSYLNPKQKTSSDKKKVLGRERKIYKDGRKSYIIYKKEKMWLSDARALEKTIINK